MNWHYAINNERLGPFSDAQFEELCRNGVIQPGTMVWHDGLAQWQTFASLPPSSPPPLNALLCAQCGRSFSADELVRFGDTPVCAECKPLFLQKLREGLSVAAPAVLNYAGFWIRFGAILVDGIIMWTVSLVLGMAAGLSFVEATGFGGDSEMTTKDTILLAVQIAIGAAYEILMVSKFGASLGKMAFGLKVVTAEGWRISFWRSVARYFAAALSYLSCGIGFIMAAFDGQKRALHDRICGTRVIKIRKD